VAEEEDAHLPQGFKCSSTTGHIWMLQIQGFFVLFLKEVKKADALQ